mgnify:CR=1 FL=1
MKILFVHDSKYEVKDGLWAALNLLEKQGFEIVMVNLFERPDFVDLTPTDTSDWFVLGWGAFNSKVDNLISAPNKFMGMKKGLCIAGNSFPPDSQDRYDILFYETEWYLPQIQHHKNVVRAFGINSDIYKPIPDAIKIWDWLTVGSFALWKRHYLFKEKGGYKLAIGEIQKENMSESIDIIGDLLLNNIAVSDMIEPEKLAMLYNSSNKTFVGADINGGGERAVLESLSCGTPVFVESDNPKLEELTVWKERGRVPDQHWYSDKLREGIESCF